ncbi:hypothetical protein NC653_028586 [Populus alba x Populus x berolinensis]|uniref:Uncharacterized protein n=1 Tax=Populus alba x Populus x berolinensis TaxID=444605 RepID=A0AAD6Q3K1_9ROSI|nr:hypothetical protein NC653_028586 [Populus alba x Populus x berolinensis]
MNSGAGGILDKCKGFGLADNLQLSIQEFRTNPFLISRVIWKNETSNAFRERKIHLSCEFKHRAM